MSERLVRPRKDRRIAGVAAGIAQRYGWDPTAVRLAMLASLLLPGPQVILYLAAWIIIPDEEDAARQQLPPPPSPPQVGDER